MKKLLMASLVVTGLVAGGCAVEGDVGASNATYVPKRADSSQYMTGTRLPHMDSGAKLLVPDDNDRMQMSSPKQQNPSGR
ncbi:MAG: hypothetical protein ACM3X5_03460 [Bacillota bacterium]